ncbi:eukaryotic translation initiation factor 2A, partial [Aureobasidium melanogenum]
MPLSTRRRGLVVAVRMCWPSGDHSQILALLASMVETFCDNNEATVRRENNGVARTKVEAVLGNSTLVEDGRLSRHVAIDDTEFLGVGRPGDVVNRTILVQGNARVKSAAGAKNVHVGLAVVTLVGLVDIGLGQDDQASTLVVPLELDLIGLEEGLLRDRRGEVGDVEDLDLSRHALALWHKDGNIGIAAQIRRLVEVHLVGDSTGTEFLVQSVLQVPASLVLLYELANDLAAGVVVEGAPDLEVLDSVAVFVLGRPLPGNDTTC